MIHWDPSLQVCHNIGAQLLIDDSVENALACAGANPPVSVLLFGDYQWNKRESKVDCPEDHLGYDDRLKAEGGHEWWKDDLVDGKLPRSVNRVKNWKEVVSWAKENLARTSESSVSSDTASIHIDYHTNALVGMLCISAAQID